MSRNESKSGRTGERHFFSARHVRGWIVSVVLLIDLLLAVRMILVTVYLAQEHNTAGLLAGQTPLYATMIALVLLAIVAGSRRASGFVLRVSKWVSISLHLHPRPKPAKKRQKSPPPVPANGALEDSDKLDGVA